jgi:hypothetical protein
VSDHWAVAKKALIAAGKYKAASPEGEAALPVEAFHLWAVFVDLDQGREAGFSGGQPISHMEIAARCQNMDDPLAPWEIRTIRALDSLRRSDDKDGGATDG